MPHYSSEELKKKYLQNKDPIESRRWHLVWQVSQGWTIKRSAMAVGISYDYGIKIVKRYNEQGEEGLKNRKKGVKKKGGGKRGLLTPEELKRLAKVLKERPSDGGIWTGPKVARWIEKETGREKVWNQRGWDYLKKLEYSWQSPRPKHRKGNKEEQDKFKHNLPEILEKLKQDAPNIETELWCFDEHRVGLKPILRKVWAKKGERPLAVVSHRYQWLYVYGFVEPKTGRTFWYLIPRVNTEWLNLVYQQFAQDVGASDKRILLIEDNAGWHRSSKVEVPEGITVEFLPPYSPELQPAERLWTLVDEPLVNEYFETIDDMEEVLVKRCNVLREREDMQQKIKDLTYYSWLQIS